MHFSCLVVATDVDDELEPFAEYHKVAQFRHFVEPDEIRLMAEEYAVEPTDLVGLAKRLREGARKTAAFTKGVSSRGQQRTLRRSSIGTRSAAALVLSYSSESPESRGGGSAYVVNG